MFKHFAFLGLQQFVQVEFAGGIDTMREEGLLSQSSNPSSQEVATPPKRKRHMQKMVEHMVLDSAEDKKYKKMKVEFMEMEQKRLQDETVKKAQMQKEVQKDVHLERLKNVRTEIRALKKLQCEEGDEDGSITMDIELYTQIVKECYEALGGHVL